MREGLDTREVQRTRARRESWTWAHTDPVLTLSTTISKDQGLDLL